jgi:hypothetical protein
VWRLGRQVSYVIVAAQLKLRPARQPEHWAADRGSTNTSQALVFLTPASSSPRWKQASNRLVFLCRYGTASGEPASTTDQKPALESAGLCGQVESGHPSLPSSLEKVGGGTR